MEPTIEMVDALFRERVLRARRTAPEQKLLEGPRLFDIACRIMKDGIRNQYPNADEAQVLEMARKRLALAKRLEESP